MKERKSNIEILRIIAMSVIILSHIATHGKVNYGSICPNKIITEQYKFGGWIGDNLFILIMGYFQINKPFSCKRFLKLLCQVTFYSVILYAVSCLIGQSDFSMKTLFQSSVPLLCGGAYWFIVTYMMVYVFSPIINHGIKELSKNQLFAILVFFGFIYVIVPNFIHQVISVNDFGQNNFTWMVYFYTIGATLQLYPIKNRNNTAISIALLICVAIILAFRGIRTAEIINEQSTSGRFLILFLTFFSRRALEGTMVIIVSTLLFLLLSSRDIGSITWINRISSTMFGVYLIHDHPVFRDYMWIKVFRIPYFQDKPYFFLYSLLVIAIILSIGSMMDTLRQKVIESPLFSSTKLNQMCASFDSWLEK